MRHVIVVFMRYVFVLIIYFTLTDVIFAGAVINVSKTNILMQQRQKRVYVDVQNIGDAVGTFTVTVQNVTDPKHPITYDNKQLKALPILIYNLKPKSRKRIALTRNPRIKLISPVNLVLSIREYKKPAHLAKDDVKSGAGIEVHAAIVNHIKVMVQ